MTMQEPLEELLAHLKAAIEAAEGGSGDEAEGKLAVRCLAPTAGLGVADPEKRERIGEDKITLFERHTRGEL